jgi:hypothetical protein
MFQVRRKQLKLCTCALQTPLVALAIVAVAVAAILAAKHQSRHAGALYIDSLLRKAEHKVRSGMQPGDFDISHHKQWPDTTLGTKQITGQQLQSSHSSLSQLDWKASQLRSAVTTGSILLPQRFERHSKRAKRSFLPTITHHSQLAALRPSAFSAAAQV